MKRFALMLAIATLAACSSPDQNDTPECRRWQAAYQGAESLPEPSYIQGPLLMKRPEGCEIP